MKPFINLEENIGKIVGRRTAPKDAFKYAMGLQNTVNQLSESFGHGPLCPKGVFRFKTHEEADLWMTTMLARRTIRKS